MNTLSGFKLCIRLCAGKTRRKMRHRISGISFGCLNRAMALSIHNQSFSPARSVARNQLRRSARNLCHPGAILHHSSDQNCLPAPVPLSPPTGSSCTPPSAMLASMLFPSLSARLLLLAKRFSFRSYSIASWRACTPVNQKPKLAPAPAKMG